MKDKGPFLRGTHPGPRCCGQAHPSTPESLRKGRPLQLYVSRRRYSRWTRLLGLPTPDGNVSFSVPGPSREKGPPPTQGWAGEGRGETRRLGTPRRRSRGGRNYTNRRSLHPTPRPDSTLSPTDLFQHAPGAPRTSVPWERGPGWGPYSGTDRHAHGNGKTY